MLRRGLILALPVLVLAVGAQAQLITAVEETGGEEEGIAFTGQTIEHVALGTLTVPVFNEDAPAFTDRTHQWNDIPAALVGGEYIMTANDARDNEDFQLDVTVGEPVTAYVLVDQRVNVAENMPWLAEQTWTLTDMTVGVDEGGDGDIDQTSDVWVHAFPAGTFSTFQQGQGSTNMYGVVVIPEPATLGLLALGGLAVLRRRR